MGVFFVVLLSIAKFFWGITYCVIFWRQWMHWVFFFCAVVKESFACWCMLHFFPRELQDECQRSLSFQEKSGRLTQIKEKLEQEAVCRKNPSYPSLQEMLIVHQVEYVLFIFSYKNYVKTALLAHFNQQSW